MRKLQKEFEKLKEYLYKNNIKWSFVIRSTIYVICCGIMFYQVSSSCMEYYKYNTVVQIKIAKPANQAMPAISVCRQMKVTEYVETLRKFDQEFKAMIEKNPVQSTQPRSESDQNVTEEKEEEKQWDALGQLAKYFDLENRNSEQLLNYLKQDYLKVSCWDVRSSNTKSDCINSAHAINSFNQRRLCITYFSKLYRNFNFSEQSFNISNDNETTEKREDAESVFAWFQIENPNNDTFIYIHTSKSMPDINLYDLEMTRSRLFSNKTYGVIYSKYWVRRLEEPFVTKCENYVRNRQSWTDSLSEFGCITKCKKNYWRTQTENACIPIDLVYILESEDGYQNQSICNCTVKPCDKTMNKCEKCPHADSEEYKKWSTDCENNCPEDCYEEYYQKDMFELRDDFEQNIWLKYEIKKEELTLNHTLVFLAAKYQEEISYTHVAKTSQFDFFATMGGLFSLWIGASVLTIYDVLEVLFKCATNFHRTVKKTKVRLGEKLQNSIKVRSELRRNREVYGNINSGRIRKHVTLPNFY